MADSTFGDFEIKEYRNMNNLRTMKIKNVVVGSGAAGYATAVRLFQSGEINTAIITENINAGTSRNTGSDKQTYYKLSLADGEDSVLNMAEDLMSGGAVDGDIALSEAALSTRGFYNLVELGVTFPCTEFGEYIGYKTDHDRGKRATSAGPYTSKMMTEKLEKKAKELEIEIIGNLQLIHIFTDDEHVTGALFYERGERKDESISTHLFDASNENSAKLNLSSVNEGEKIPFVLVQCENLILATGGPAELFHDRVYPASQFGATGVALSCGIHGQNLTEWQFGMASLSPRWNVSGTYMQTLPRFISINPDGSCEREFLLDFFKNKYEMMSMIFLKGYQWPFDVRKVINGSSIIDLLVYKETVLNGRHVYLDFTRNSCDEDIDFECLSDEAKLYLKNADVCFGTPIERLRKMNMPAVQFYMDKEVDLSRDYLEIAVCAQHNNGGLSVNSKWETSVHGIFAAGEAAGTHGIFRPGGSALNSGQAAAIRIAETISQRKEELFERKEKSNLLERAKEVVKLVTYIHGTTPVYELYRQVTKHMSLHAAMIRNSDKLREELKDMNKLWLSLPDLEKRPKNKEEWILHFHLRDTLIAAIVYISAMLDYVEKGHKSRGSALYTDSYGVLPDVSFPEIFRFTEDDGGGQDIIQECALKFTEARPHTEIQWRPVRPIPCENYFFEKQWAGYRARFGIK